MGRRRGSQVALHGASEMVSTSDQWLLRGDPREAAKLWRPSDDREEWFSQDYDDRARFSNIVDPFWLVCPPDYKRRPVFPWELIEAVTGFAKGCLVQRPCRTLLLRRIRPEWYACAILERMREELKRWGSPAGLLSVPLPAELQPGEPPVGGAPA